MEVWKYPLEIVDCQYLTMPESAELLAVQVQGRVGTLWARVDQYARRVKRRVCIRGTGHPEAAGPYVDTFQTANGTLVWHVFDGGEFPLDT